ncbi:TonB-dependent receptor [Anthocerotibacter panamensis]|uniref:TonB-dependent receptor n=1 Tax=Anthocerotibacter panamensis TaxID=2857077 RepID=UPI001C4025C8|nr:TonB-dependent receptor [Anthocerotibacter panamensis]
MSKSWSLFTLALAVPLAACAQAEPSFSLDSNPKLLDKQTLLAGQRTQAEALTLAQKPLPDSADSDDGTVDLLDEYTVTANLGRRTSVRESTSSVTIVNQGEIQRTGSRQVGDALRGVSGVVSNLFGAGEDVHSAYFIRGLPATSTALLIDGRSVNNLNQEQADLAELPVFGIERVEVLKGGATTLYGSTAVGGVINVITERPPDKFTLDTNVTFGSYGYSNYSVQVGSPLGQSVRFSAFATTFNTNSDFTYQVARPERTLFGVTYPAETLTGIRPNGEVNSTTFGLNLDWDIDERTSVSSSSYWRKGIRGLNLVALTDQRGLLPVAGDPGCAAGAFCTPNELGLNDETRIRTRIEYFGTGLTFNRKLGEGDDSKLQLRLGYDTGFGTETDISPEGVQEEDASVHIDIYNLRLLHDWQISPGFNLTYGFDFIRETGRAFTLNLETPGSLQEPTFTAQVNRPSLFALGTLKLAEKVTATLGLRETFGSNYAFTSASALIGSGSRTFASSLDPSVGIVWEVAPNLTLRTSFAKVYKTPNFNDLFANGTDQGNPNLLAESGSTFDVGLDWQPTPQTNVRAAYFLSDIQNLLTFNRITPAQDGNFTPQDQALLDQGYAPGNLVRVNFPQTRFSGFELRFDWRFAPGWNFFATETYTDARVVQGFKDEINDSQYPLVPFHSGQTGFSYRSPGDWRVSLFANFQGLRASDPYHIGPGVGFTPNGDLARFPGGNLIANSSALPTASLLPGYFTLDLTVRIPINPAVTLTGLINNLTNLAYERNFGNGAPPINFTVGLESSF